MKPPDLEHLMSDDPNWHCGHNEDRSRWLMQDAFGRRWEIYREAGRSPLGKKRWWYATVDGEEVHLPGMKKRKYWADLPEAKKAVDQYALDIRRVALGTPPLAALVRCRSCNRLFTYKAYVALPLVKIIRIEDRPDEHSRTCPHCPVRKGELRVRLAGDDKGRPVFFNDMFTDSQSGVMLCRG